MTSIRIALALTACAVASLASPSSAEPAAVDQVAWNSLKKEARLRNGLRLTYVEAGNPRRHPGRLGRGSIRVCLRRARRISSHVSPSPWWGARPDDTAPQGVMVPQIINTVYLWRVPHLSRTGVGTRRRQHPRGCNALTGDTLSHAVSLTCG